MRISETNVAAARAEFIHWVKKRNADISMSDIEFLIGPAPDRSGDYDTGSKNQNSEVRHEVDSAFMIKSC